MSDPIERLSRLGSNFEGGPMLPPEEIRRRGERIRRRRTAVVAAGSAAAVAAVAVPVLALTGGGGGGPQPADTPSVVDPAQAPLTAEDLITDAETVYSDGADWVARLTGEGDGQDVFNPCAQQSLAGLGASAVFRRDFELRAIDGGEPAPGDWMTAMVAEFPDEEAAGDAYDTVADWVVGCEEAFPEAERSSTNGPTPVDPGVDGTAEAYLSMFAPVPESVDPFGDMGYFIETGLVVSGNRLAVLSSVIIGMDYNFMDGTPVQQMLPAAAERLQPGAAPTTGNPSEDPAPDEGTGAAPDVVPTDVPDGFPLDVALGEPPTPGSETTIGGPAPDAQGVLPLALCGDDASMPDSDEAGLHYSVGVIEGYDGRSLQVFPTAEEAVTAVEELRQQVAACERDRGPRGQSDRLWRTFDEGDGTGYDSITFGYTYEVTDDAGAPAGELFTVVRVGNAVLAVEFAGEYGVEALELAVPRQLDLVSAIATEMCVFTEDGC